VKTEAIQFRDRQSGQLVPESIPGEGALRWFYQSRLGFLCFSLFVNHAFVCRLYGWWQESAWSRRKIEPFVDRYHVDLGEVELPLECYPSFNAFFTRRLRPGVRSFCAEAQVLCAPADGKALVCPRLEEGSRLPVKGEGISAAQMLGSEEEGHRYQGGAALVVRLAPYDYHRSMEGATKTVGSHVFWWAAFYVALLLIFRGIRWIALGFLDKPEQA